MDEEETRMRRRRRNRRKRWMRRKWRRRRLQLQCHLPQQCSRDVLVGQGNCFFPVHKEGEKEKEKEEEGEVEEEEENNEEGTRSQRQCSLTQQWNMVVLVVQGNSFFLSSK